MQTTCCPECGAETKYDLATCTIHVYKQDGCHHIKLECSSPKHHKFNLYLDMGWLENLKKKFPGMRFNMEPHGKAPETIFNEAKRAWHQQPIVESWNREIDFFSDTGIMFS